MSARSRGLSAGLQSRGRRGTSGSHRERTLSRGGGRGMVQRPRRGGRCLLLIRLSSDIKRCGSNVTTRRRVGSKRGNDQVSESQKHAELSGRRSLRPPWRISPWRQPACRHTTSLLLLLLLLFLEPTAAPGGKQMNCGCSFPPLLFFLPPSFKATLAQRARRVGGTPARHSG